MSANPCQICGCTDLNLVDGFYYCVECGTQDVNVRETVVEKSVYDDGTFTAFDTKKLRSTVLKDAVQMSGEWRKWHAYNFILSGLTDELIAAGAKPTVKIKVLWIWLRYIKKFQKKDEPEATIFENNSSSKDDEKELNEDDEKDLNEDDEKDLNENDEKELNRDDANNELDGSDEENKPHNKDISEKFTVDIKSITKTMLLTILYIALNLDRSDIQLSHLFQFIREGHLSLHDCIKFVPKELSFQSTPNYFNFIKSFRCEDGCTPVRIRAVAMTLFKRLGLGVPLAPDLNKIINNFIRELCLPDDFKDLVLSLTNLLPCDLQMNALSMKRPTRIPDYEAVCMSYVLLALKMCFGLDCDYEIKLSNAVDKINCEENYLKFYKLGMYSEPTDRLFSFREWCMFTQFRKMVLSKYYLPMASQYHLPVDDCVFLEQSEPRKISKMRLSYDVAMDILNKIPSDETNIVSKKEFPVTLTPMTTYTEVIIEYIGDPDLKLRLCEDFTQYSLKYAMRDLKLPGHNEISKGVDKLNKIINPFVVGSLISKVGDTTMVLVRNCDNKNWLKTRPPEIKHVTKISDNSSDYGCDFSSDLMSNTVTDESRSVDQDLKHDSCEEMCDFIEEEDQELSIYDDDFKNLQIEEDDEGDLTKLQEIDAFEFHNDNFHDRKSVSSLSEISTPEMVFNPETFNREKVIQELIKIACKEYKIPLPKEKEDREPIKRKNFEKSEAGESKPKRKKSTNRLKPGEAVKMTQGLIDAYYENISNDLLLKISEHVKSVMETVDNHITDDVHRQTEEIDAQHQNGIEENLEGDDNYQNDIEQNMRGDDNDENAFVHENNNQDNTAINASDDEDDKEYNIKELLPKINPKFDPKTHDINQLYVNLNEEFENFDIANIDIDPAINEMIDKKIAEFHDFDENYKKSQRDDTEKGETKSESNDSDDDMFEDKLSPVRNRDTSNFEYLVHNRNIENFWYWTKHYKSRVFTSSLSLNHKFNVELAQNCSKSFCFILNECAVISNCSAYSLYKNLTVLEQQLLNHTRKKCKLSTNFKK